MILPPIVYHDAASSAVTFQVIIQLDRPTLDDQASAAVMAQALTRETADYTSSKIALVLAGAGDSIHWDLTNDHLRFWFTVPKADESHGFALLESLLKRPLLTEETIERARQAVTKNRMTPWQVVLSPECHDPSKVRSSEVVRLYQTLIRPDRLTFALGGDVEDAQATLSLRKRLDSWHPARPKQVFIPFLPDRQLSPQVPILSLTGPEIDPKAIAVNMLAAYAIGCGKRSSVFRVWRETNRLSYVQACGIEGTAKGFRIDSWFAFSEDKTKLTETAEQASKALQADIDTWTEGDRKRALALAESVLLRGLEFSPLWFSSRGPLSNSLEDRTFLGAYWQQKTGSPWNPEALLKDMSSVSLDDLKAAASSYLQNSQPKVRS